jgi:hypothetical protein
LKKHPVLLTRLVFGAVMLDYEQKEFWSNNKYDVWWTVFVFPKK